MADVTLLNIRKGVKTSWAAATSLNALVPASRLYLDRVPAGTAYPCATYSFKDVSAFYGGTTYQSGSAYFKVTQVLISIYAKRSVDWDAVCQAVSDAFGWSESNAAASWSIPNATILAGMPEVEAFEVEPERVDSEDIERYDTSFTVRMQALRGAASSAQFRDGNGGYFKWGNNRIDVVDWSGDFAAVLADVSTSASGSRKLAKVIEENGWEAECLWDESNMPDTTAGLTPGTVGTVRLQIGGGSSKYYLLTDTTAERVRIRNTNTDGVVKATLAGRGGVITRPA